MCMCTVYVYRVKKNTLSLRFSAPDFLKPSFLISVFSPRPVNYTRDDNNQEINNSTHEHGGNVWHQYCPWGEGQ